MARIAVIDDDPGVRETVGSMLAKSGHEVATAADGPRGLALCDDPAIDLAILDVWLPEVDGITVLKQVRAARADLPVIVISGGGRLPLEYSTALADSHGAAEVLFKPFTPTELLAVVDRLLGPATATPDDPT